MRREIGIALLAGLLAVPALPAAAQQRRATAARPAQFEQVASKAKQAREAGRVDEAIGHYREGVKIRANWDEGWWFLGTLLYDRERYAEAAEALETATKLQPKAGIAWIMLGLCEYRIGRYDAAAEHLIEGRRLGFGNSAELQRVVLYHEGVLGLFRGEFEAAQKRLDDVAYAGARSEQLFIALGLVVLRIPMLPEQISPDHKNYTLIRQAGFAEYQLAQNNVADASREYERLASDYPKFPNVQYAYGRYHLVQRNADEALAAFHREIENSPNHAMARLQIAYIHMSRKEPEIGIKYAEEAVNLGPRFAHARFLLGRLFYDVGNYPRAIEELEAAQQLAPTEPKVYYSLARAYDRVQRKEDAKRAREVFAELSRRAEGTSMPDDTTPATP